MQMLMEVFKKLEKRKQIILLLFTFIICFSTFWTLRYIGIAVNGDDNLSSFLENVVMKVDNVPINGGEKINVSQTVEIALDFLIDLTENNKDQVFIYHLPSPLIVPSEISNKPLIDNVTGSQTGEYHISSDGVLTITLNQDYIEKNDYCNVNIDFLAGWLPGSSGDVKLNFGNGHIKDIFLDYDSSMVVNKTYNMKWGKEGKRTAEFTISVVAYKDQENIKITDTVEYSAGVGAKFKVGDLIKAGIIDRNGNIKGDVFETTIKNQNTLNELLANYSIDLKAGETLIIIYVMELSEEDAWNANVNNLLIRTTNKVKVTSSEYPDGLEDSVNWDYWGSKNNILSKSSFKVDDDLSLTQWELYVNKMAGFPIDETMIITDSLKSTYLEYATNTEFLVDVYDKNNNLIRTDTVSWQDVLSEDHRLFTYKPPEKDYGKYYYYHVKYFTRTLDGYPEGEILSNSATVNYSDFESVGTGGIANNINISLSKRGTPNSKTKTIDWDIDFIVYPGSGQIKDFILYDYLPKYKTKDNRDKYSQVVNQFNEKYSGENDIKKFVDFMNEAIDIKVLEYNGQRDFTNLEEFSMFKYFYVYHRLVGNELDAFQIQKLDGMEIGNFTLPEATGEFRNGYIIRISYRTIADDSKDGETFINSANAQFANKDNKTDTVMTNAQAIFDIMDVQHSVDVSKSVIEANRDDGIIYKVQIDKEGVGLRGANRMTWVDEFDDRLVFNDNKIILEIEGLNSPTSSDSFEINLYENLNTLFPSKKIDENTYEQSFGMVPTVNGDAQELIITTKIDNDNHCLTISFNHLTASNDSSVSNISYAIKYRMNLKESDYGTYQGITNKFSLYGNDQTIVYGEDICVYDFLNSILAKRYSLNKKLENVVDFKIDTVITDELLKKGSIIFEDTMSNNLVPMLDTLSVSLEVPTIEKSAYPLDKESDLSATFIRMYHRIPELRIVKNWPNSNLVLFEFDFGQDTLKEYVDAYIRMAAELGVPGLSADDIRLVLTYQSKIDGPSGTIASLTNTANIRDVKNSTGKVNFSHLIVGNGGTTTGISRSIVIKKQEASTVTGSDFITLPGAKFNLYDENNQMIASGITDDKGELIFGASGTDSSKCNLELYTPYYFVEVEAPPGGYVLDNTPYWFYLARIDRSASDETVVKALEDKGYHEVLMGNTIVRTNSKKASLLISKIDSKSKKLLVGAEFRLFNNKELTDEYSVAADLNNGNYLFNDIDLGKMYYLKEIRAPEYYSIQEKVYVIEVSNKGVVTVLDETLNSEDNSLYIENDYIEFSLPTTGGGGIFMYIIVGIFVIISGIIFESYLVQKGVVSLK